MVGQVFGNVTILAKIVFFLGLCNSSVFNSLSGAVADTGHTMGALVAPDWFVVFQRNIVQRT